MEGVLWRGILGDGGVEVGGVLREVRDRGMVCVVLMEESKFF